jgi:hypothetical protein
MTTLSEKQHFMNDFNLKYENSIETIFETFGQKWFDLCFTFKLI